MEQDPNNEEVKHSPLPWHAATFAVYANDSRPAAHTGACGYSNEERIANAEFIARACNAHDELVAALTELVAVLEGDEEVSLWRANNALALASRGK